MIENKIDLKTKISEKRFQITVKRKKAKQNKRRIEHENYLRIKKYFGGKVTYEKLLENWLPTNLDYLLNCEKAAFHNTLPFKNVYDKIKIPTNFSLIDHPKESHNFIRKLTISILSLKFSKIEIDYSDCINIDLGAQIYLDIILKDLLKFINKCKTSPIKSPNFPNISGSNINNPNIQKMLFSVGSPAILNKKSVPFKDIITYKLCIHNKESNANRVKNAERKEIDSTEMVYYIIDSLKRLGKKLTSDKIEDFSTVIGEALINAEEHSTTQHRFSTGYFQEHRINNEHFGIFNLVILNFGETIYQKFNSPDCTNYDIVNKMKNLSKKFTKKKIFSNNFTEENLWTLYALQEGVTSVSTKDYKRGNGSIRFIESFFNIKGVNGNKDDISRLSIISGSTNITFDGSYNIIDNGKFKIMAFNKEGNIEEKPDKTYVKNVNEYFPGTMISARILINKDDIV